MRRTLTVCRTGLTVAAAVLVLSGCGGSNDTSSSPSAEASSSSSGTSAEPADSPFCAQAADALTALQQALSAQGDAASQAPGLQQAADAVRAIQAPSEIAADWTAVADGIEQIAQAFGGADENDPASKAALQQRATEIFGQLSGPATNVQNYLAERCGLGTVTTESASPSS